MRTVKRWTFRKTDFDQSDILWLRKYAHDLQVKHAREEINTPRGSYYYQGKSSVYVQTITQEQESMLYLKYGDDMILMSMVHGYPGQVLQDEYGTITFI